MATTWVEALPSDHRRIIMSQLLHGRNRARELHSLLNNGGEDGSTSRSKEELVMEIVTTFTESLSVLSESSNLCGGDDHHSGTTGCGGGVIVKAEQSHVEHSHCGDRSSEDSGESKKRPGLKDRRGCYKRRKNSESWTKVSSTIDDGQAWRKYGQKEILNAPYPRAYFRCTRKYDQGCQATKQVQQFQDTPKLYNATYIGKHTCKNMNGAPQIIMGTSDPPMLDSHAPPRATVSSESESTTAICKKKEHNGDHGGYLSSSSSMIPFNPVKKEESKEGPTSSDLTDNLNDRSDMWPELNFGFPETTVMSSMEYLDMDLELDKSISFEKFDFDEVVFT